MTEEPEIYEPNFIFFKRIFEAFKVQGVCALSGPHSMGMGCGGDETGIIVCIQGSKWRCVRRMRFSNALSP